MTIGMQSGARPADLTAPRWSLAVVGGAVDERGKTAIDFCKTRAETTAVATYDPDEIMLSIGNCRYSADDLEGLAQAVPSRSLLLEATTLGLVEVFLFCRAAREAGFGGVSLLYVEPSGYRADRSQVLLRRDFELSDNVPSFTGVPNAVLLRELTKTRFVFLVGYEGQRLERAIEQTDARPSDCSIVFGVPAFQPGWEMDSFANNIRVIHDRGIGELCYTGAQNPAGAYAALERLHASCEPGQRLLVSPIGTKPHGIGAALFACDHEHVGLLYDNPARKQGRTIQVATWHLFDVAFADSDQRYYTPDQVAQVLADWIPPDVHHLLEPAVGHGALLAPLLERDCRRVETVVCVDTDEEALTAARSLLEAKLGDTLRMQHGDFLELDLAAANVMPSGGFDCVVLNPPFAGRRWQRSVFLGPGRSSLEGMPMQTETAFLYKSIHVLRAGGRLLAVVPASVVMSDTGEGIRQFMIGSGAIEAVYNYLSVRSPGWRRGSTSWSLPKAAGLREARSSYSGMSRVQSPCLRTRPRCHRQPGSI